MIGPVCLRAALAGRFNEDVLLKLKQPLRRNRSWFTSESLVLAQLIVGCTSLPLFLRSRLEFVHAVLTATLGPLLALWAHTAVLRFARGAALGDDFRRRAPILYAVTRRSLIPPMLFLWPLVRALDQIMSGIRTYLACGLTCFCVPVTVTMSMWAVWGSGAGSQDASGALTLARVVAVSGALVGSIVWTGLSKRCYQYARTTQYNEKLGMDVPDGVPEIPEITEETPSDDW